MNLYQHLFTYLLLIVWLLASYYFNRKASYAVGDTQDGYRLLTGICLIISAIIVGAYVLANIARVYTYLGSL